MKFLWPEALLLLLLVPLVAALYVWLLGRRKRLALRYANLPLVREAMGRAAGWRRHVPPLLFLAALAALFVAVARPTAVITLPSQQETVILAMDVSGSMRATDVEPNRLVAAQNAAKAFISDQPMSTRIGIVSFAGTAALVQPPTQNREDLVAAIDRFQLQRATAIGSGIIVSLAAIFPDAGIDISQLTLGGRDQRGASLDAPKKDGAKEAFKPVPPGSFQSAVIILLTDGQRTTGPDPVEAAKMAADRGVRVFTVGVGTPQGEVIGFEGWSMRVRLDEDTLKQIAQITHAEYFYAGTAVDLKKIYQNLNTRLVFERKETEVSAIFAAAGALLALVAAGLSVLWFHRIL
ncbi:MAG TPA: VWA domain-containing protein [Casimicrobiaceae bacterium]|nr:VWA domain-containing protein [Casimicrobiaceae bacterium]